MRYFKVIGSGKILCTFLRPGSRTGETEIIHRCDPVFLEFPDHDPGRACYPSPEIPSERDHGKLIEISEAEAMAIDPELFRDGFQDYEEMKRLEPMPTPAKKRKVVRESALTQETLF